MFPISIQYFTIFVMQIVGNEKETKSAGEQTRDPY